MELSPCTKSELFAWNDGRRIVDLSELSKQLHCKQCSSLLDLQRTEREARYGLASILYIWCSCGLVNDVHTGKIQRNDNAANAGSGNGNPMFDINIKASINLLMYGAGASRILNFLALLDVPVPPPDDTSLIVPVASDSELQSAAMSHPDSITRPVHPITPPIVTRPIPPINAMISQTSAEDFNVDSYPSSSFETAVKFSSEPQFVLSQHVGKKKSVPSSDDDKHVGTNQSGQERENAKQDKSNAPKTKAIVVLEKLSGESEKHDESHSSKTKAKVGPQKSLIKTEPVIPKKSPIKTKAGRNVKQTVKFQDNAFDILSGSSTEAEDEQDEKDKKKKDKDDSWHEDDTDAKLEEETEETEEDEDDDEDELYDLECFFEEEQEDDDEEEEGGEEEEEMREGEETGATGGEDLESGGGGGEGKGGTPLKRKRSRPLKDSPIASTSGLAKKVKKKKKKAIPNCEVCKKFFRSMNGYNLHMRRTHNQERKEEKLDLEKLDPEKLDAEKLDLKSVLLYVCTSCFEPYAKESRLAHHFSLKHWTPTAKLTDAYYTLPLTDFIAECRPPVANRRRSYFSCLHCPAFGLGPYSIAQHIRINSEGACSCKTISPAGPALKRIDYMLIFSKSDKCLICHVCGRQFLRKIDLEIHLSGHGDASMSVTRHQCHLCGAGYPTKSAFNTHMVTKHPQGQALVCEFCQKSFASKRNLRLHRMAQHIRPFECQYCPKRFDKRCVWKTHMQRHVGERPYQCLDCGKDFSTMDNLRTHQRIHTGEKPYQCKQCDASFAQKSSLNWHMKKHG